MLMIYNIISKYVKQTSIIIPQYPSPELVQSQSFILPIKMLGIIHRLQKQQPLLAYFYMIISSTCLVAMQIYVKKLSQVFSPFFVLFMRGVCLVVVNSAVIRQFGLIVDQKSKQVHRLLIKRTILSTFSVSLFMTTVAFIPMGIATSLFNTGPIFIYFLQAYYYQKPLNKLHLLLTFVCFIGVVIIIKPAFLFGEVKQSFSTIIMILPVFAALFNSMSLLYLHELKSKVSNIIALQYFYISQIFMFAFAQNFALSDNTGQIHWPMVIIDFILLAIVAYACQVTITRAVYLKKASYVMPFNYISIVLATLSDILLFGASFDFISVIGMILTSLGLISKLIIQDKQ